MIVRMHKIRPTGESFFLRLLLLHVKGTISFADLRTNNDTIFNMFREACSQLILLQDDIEWRNMLTEAAATRCLKKLDNCFPLF